MLRIYQAETGQEKQKAYTLFRNEYVLGFERRSLPPFKSSPPAAGPKPEIKFFVAEENDEAVGCLGLKKEDSKTCIMLGFYVKEDFQDRGFGKALISHVVSYARENKFSRIRLATYDREKFQKAIHLYKTFGFQKIEPYESCPKELEPFVLYMELELE